MNQFESIKKKVLSDLRGLSPLLTYHSVDHTLDVLHHSERIAGSEKVPADQLCLLKLAALYHDTGFLKAYHNHEEASIGIFNIDAEKFGLAEADREIIRSLIMATKVPQRPVGILQQILCDADLDYLGREDFHIISERLRMEFFNYNLVSNMEEWEKIQIAFLNGHHYHTRTSRMDREPLKQQYISALV